MKTMRNSCFKGLAIILLTFFIPVIKSTGAGLQKTFTWKNPANKETRIVLNNYNCDMAIHVWDRTETEFHLTVEATGLTADDEKRLADLINNFKFNNSGSEVNFHNSFWKNRQTNNKKTTLEIDGQEDIELTEFTMKGEIWIPAANPFRMDSKYSKINMDDFSGNLFLDLYNSDLYAGNFTNNSEITAKYSNIEVRDMKDLKADLYNCNFEAVSTGKISVVSKYSKFTAGTSGNIVADSYNDKFSFEKTGDIDFNSKYSDLKTNIAGMAELECYNGMFVFGETKDMVLDSKYADFQVSKAGKCSVNNSYNDKFRFGQINSLQINVSKYSNYKAERISGNLVESDGHNDKFTISTVGGFKEINLEGKYLDISLGIPQSSDYRLTASIQYPALDLDETPIRTKTKILQNSSLQYEGIKGAETPGMPEIKVKGYNVSLSLTDIK